jgi:hypothetical protein
MMLAGEIVNGTVERSQRGFYHGRNPQRKQEMSGAQGRAIGMPPTGNVVVTISVWP